MGRRHEGSGGGRPAAAATHNPVAPRGCGDATTTSPRRSTTFVVLIQTTTAGAPGVSAGTRSTACEPPALYARPWEWVGWAQTDYSQRDKRHIHELGATAKVGQRRLTR